MRLVCTAVLALVALSACEEERAPIVEPNRYEKPRKERDAGPGSDDDGSVPQAGAGGGSPGTAGGMSVPADGDPFNPAPGEVAPQEPVNYALDPKKVYLVTL